MSAKFELSRSERQIIPSLLAFQTILCMGLVCLFHAAARMVKLGAPIFGGACPFLYSGGENRHRFDLSDAKISEPNHREIYKKTEFNQYQIKS